jgi:large subunit ribosomal protein L31
MKNDIHPKSYALNITCACGSTLASFSTQAEIRLDICSLCHPFFTGTQQIIDTEGRIERFQKKYGDMKPVSAKAPAKRAKVPPTKAPAAKPKVAKPAAAENSPAPAPPPA